MNISYSFYYTFNNKSKHVQKTNRRQILRANQ